MDINESIKVNFKKLSRGLMQLNYPTAYEAHKILYEIGQPVIPILKEKILEIEWSNSRYKELSGYLSGLYSLLYDLDEDVALTICEKVISNGCPKHIKAILKSVNQFSIKNYKRYHVRGIEVFQHKLVDAKCDVGFYLNSWMGNIPEKDLDFISRIYVVTREKINAAGTYTPQLNAIGLLWDNPFKDRSIRFWFFSLLTEKVLYHEIGHHKHRHKFGTDPDQEKEADSYAFKLMREKHPFFFMLVALLPKWGIKCDRNYYRWGL
jgi:hypothetical protein